MQAKTRPASMPMGRWLPLVLLGLLVSPAISALEPKDSRSYLDQKEFFKPELYISSSHAAAGGRSCRTSRTRRPGRASWRPGDDAGESRCKAFVDPALRRGHQPGGGLPAPPRPRRGQPGRRSADVSARLGRPVQAVDARAVADAVLGFVRRAQGPAGDRRHAARRASAPSRSPPTCGRSASRSSTTASRCATGAWPPPSTTATWSLIGTETWGNVRGLSPVPKLDGAAALAAGFAYAGGALGHGRDPCGSRRWRSSRSRRRSTSAARASAARSAPATATGWSGPSSSAGRPRTPLWEVMVDAHDGEVLAFQDTNHYVNRADHGRRLSADQHRDLPDPAAPAAPCRPAGPCPSRTPAWPRPTTSPTAPASSTTRAAPSPPP